MAGTRNNCRILPSRVAQATLSKPPSRVLAELVALAEVDQSISDLSRGLFQTLRKLIGSADLAGTLLGIQYLAFKGGVPGARLLAAYLDVTTAGARLLPFVRNFQNTRRQQLLIENLNAGLDSSAKDWYARAKSLNGVCNNYPLNEPGTGLRDSWTSMQEVLSQLLADAITGKGISASDRQLLVGLLRLETDAWEERIGRLAGMVDPFRASSVRRILPLLGQADVNIRDIRQLVSWVEEGQDRQAFTRQGSRALEVLEANEFNTIFDTMKNELKLQVMSGLHRGGRDNPLKIDDLGMGVARLMALDCRLIEHGFQQENLDLISAVALVQQHARGKSFSLPLDLEQEAMLQIVLSSPELKSPLEIGPTSWPFDGFVLEAGQLVLEFEKNTGDLNSWPHGLPTTEDIDPALSAAAVKSSEETEGIEEKKDELDASAIKHMVMSNIMSVSVLLGFLRNPKVISIPGLVEAVANRTRNPQVIETIAQDRALYSGFANREVPLACLRSPCNVSPKVLRKFIHVKFVSKIDLKRMAEDRTGIRKEISREIRNYLDVLG